MALGTADTNHSSGQPNNTNRPPPPRRRPEGMPEALAHEIYEFLLPKVTGAQPFTAKEVTATILALWGAHPDNPLVPRNLDHPFTPEGVPCRALEIAFRWVFEIVYDLAPDKVIVRRLPCHECKNDNGEACFTLLLVHPTKCFPCFVSGNHNCTDPAPGEVWGAGTA